LKQIVSKRINELNLCHKTLTKLHVLNRFRLSIIILLVVTSHVATRGTGGHLLGVSSCLLKSKL